MRRAAKVDANDAALTEYARACGWYITTIKEPVDKLGHLFGLWFPIELKSKGGRLTRQQNQFVSDSLGGRVLVWYTERDVDHDTRLIRTMAEFIHSANH